MNINSPAKYVINYQKYVFLEYRQKLLDVFLQICIWITFFLLIINLIERYVDPENPWHLQNIIADLVALAILSFFLWANSRGWVNFSAWGILFLVLAVIYQSYSPRHADPGLLAIPTSCSRVADCNPDYDGFFEIRSTSRFRCPLYPPL